MSPTYFASDVPSEIPSLSRSPTYFKSDQPSTRPSVSNIPSSSNQPSMKPTQIITPIFTVIPTPVSTSLPTKASLPRIIEPEEDNSPSVNDLGITLLSVAGVLLVAAAIATYTIRFKSEEYQELNSENDLEQQIPQNFSDGLSPLVTIDPDKLLENRITQFNTSSPSSDESGQPSRASADFEKVSVSSIPQFIVPSGMFLKFIYRIMFFNTS